MLWILKLLISNFNRKMEYPYKKAEYIFLSKDLDLKLLYLRLKLIMPQLLLLDAKNCDCDRWIFRMWQKLHCQVGGKSAELHLY